jgi:IS5 family transposase
MLKMLLIAYLSDVSERPAEQQINDSFAIKWFLGLAVDEPAPHHSTLTKFRPRLLRNGNGEALEHMLDTIIHLAQEKGVEFGSIQVSDSVHTIADVNTAKDDSRKKKGKPPRDGDASWGVKHTKRERDEQGKPVERRQYFHGYKAHVSMNTGSDLTNSVGVTPGNAYGGHRLPELVESDVAKGLPFSTVTADRAHDDGEKHSLLEIKGLHSAIIVGKYSTEKKDSNEEIGQHLLSSEPYQCSIRQRYTFGRTFGEAKQGHGLGRCRYLGIDGYRMQA